MCGAGGRAHTEEEDASGSEEGTLQVSHGSGACKWFNVRMGFGFLSMTTRDGTPLDEPVDVFVHQVGYDVTASTSKASVLGSEISVGYLFTTYTKIMFIFQK